MAKTERIDRTDTRIFAYLTGGILAPVKHPELGPYRAPVEGEVISEDDIHQGAIPVRKYGIGSEPISDTTSTQT